MLIVQSGTGLLTAVGTRETMHWKEPQIKLIKYVYPVGVNKVADSLFPPL